MTVVAEDLDPVGAAESAAEAVRMLNHLTLAAPAAGVFGWGDVGDLYRVLGELRLLVERLPQVMRQLAQHLERSADSYEVDEAAPESSALTVAGAVVVLADAGERLRRARECIGAAQSATGHLYEPAPGLADAPASAAVGSLGSTGA